jgi:hypothetical protein
VASLRGSAPEVAGRDSSGVRPSLPSDLDTRTGSQNGPLDYRAPADSLHRVSTAASRPPVVTGRRDHTPRNGRRYSLSRSSALPKGGRPPVGDSWEFCPKDTTIPETVGSSPSTHFCRPGSETVARDRATSRTADGYGAGAWFAAQRSSTASTRPAAVSKSRDTLRR